jgi:hypothetical protein
MSFKFNYVCVSSVVACCASRTFIRRSDYEVARVKVSRCLRTNSGGKSHQVAYDVA